MRLLELFQVPTSVKGSSQPHTLQITHCTVFQVPRRGLLIPKLVYFKTPKRPTHPPVDIPHFASEAPLADGRLLACRFDTGYEAIRKWKDRVDIFQKEVLLVPINEQCEVGRSSCVTILL